MRQIIVLGTGTLVAVFAFAYVVLITPVSAHGDEDGETSEMTTAEASEADIKRMEALISVLKQLIAVMNELRTQYPGTSFVVPMVTTPPIADHHTEASTPKEAHTESTTEDPNEAVVPATTPDVPKLVVEIEEHSGKTHAHVRYVDGRPEAMFFVDAPMSNEDAVVTAISAQTGLGKEEVKNAIKYTGM